MRAVNSDGQGSYSGFGVIVVLPGSPPSVPTVTASVRSVGGVTVTVDPPADSGGAPVLQYAARCASTDGGLPGRASDQSTTVKVTGLAAGKQYRCRVRAANLLGYGPESTYGAPVMIPPVTSLGQVQVAVEPAVGAMIVSFTAAPNEGGSPVLQYTAECLEIRHQGAVVLDGTSTGAGSPIKVDGLVSGERYQCRVQGRSAVGNGPYSRYSPSVIVP